MKTFGVVLTIIGLITAIISYNIPIVYGESIKDTGLAFDRQNYIIGSLLVAVFGVLIVIFDSRKRK